MLLSPLKNFRAKKIMDSEKRGTGGKYQSIDDTNYSEFFCLFVSFIREACLSNFSTKVPRISSNGCNSICNATTAVL